MIDYSVRELPLFPLPDVVLFPQQLLPLHIFESRYRMMLQTVLESDKRFGVVRVDPETREMAEIGCCAEVLQHQTTEDGRSYLVTLGQQRFRVLNVTREAPFRSAMVSWIEDDQVSHHEGLNDLRDTVRDALKDVVSLTSKLQGRDVTLPEDLPDLPRELSFWIGAHLDQNAASEQQALLELTDTFERLQRQFDMLDNTRRQLAARTVLKDTFANVDGRDSRDGQDNRDS
ncbi:MAG: LON peptidase substrate-binding domain-containing protein [Cyanobacteriota bacterium]|nr:LON peptidase substrate-binding domain-containing protein [Cyanobacteriota bacterium]